MRISDESLRFARLSGFYNFLQEHVDARDHTLFIRHVVLLGKRKIVEFLLRFIEINYDIISIPSYHVCIRVCAYVCKKCVKNYNK